METMDSQDQKESSRSQRANEYVVATSRDENLDEDPQAVGIDSIIIGHQHRRNRSSFHRERDSLDSKRRREREARGGRQQRLSWVYIDLGFILNLSNAFTVWKLTVKNYDIYFFIMAI